jgi:hypothetical protein
MRKPLAVGDAVPAKRIHFPKLRMILLHYRRQAWVLDVIVTFSWMAFLAYGLIDLIFSAFRTLG